ncbi:serine/threonine-protein kinase [Marinicella litoralis]|uniref:serine/threonine-protein kinase n=1 Tax=Marinicella litoralis TaxID=644220 RepID=UPI0015D4ECCF|nr:serine/threonine-protein kinase [Marinicella litoralis]
MLPEKTDAAKDMPNKTGHDLNQTMAPGFDVTTEHDLDLTIAPARLAEQKQSVLETHTFNLAGDLAHFEIKEILGQGGMGAVYHAIDRTLHRDVAIKMLRPLAAASRMNTETLLDEARMASKLNHPNVVTIYDVARAENSNYIVMEWVDGQALNELIPETGLALDKTMEYACQIADGLTSAHQKYMIHRDIKPQNIMLSSEGIIKILDFGIAGLIHQQTEETADSAATPMTTPGIGTPSYMSPEQVQGLNLDQRSDIFSFGIVLYQMLSGKKPFVAENLEAVKQSICAGNYVPIQKHVPELPDNVIHLLEKMLTVQRDDRWQNSADLAAELHAIHAELTHSKNWWQRRHWLSKIAVLLPFVLALGWSAKEIMFPASTHQLIERQLAEATKIAILPFENISGDPLIQIFGNGLAVNLGSDLAAIARQQGNTWIVPSTEISRMKEVSPKTVADKYGVELILSGSMQHMGSTRLVVLNLLDGETGQQLKTTELIIKADELFDGHNQIRAEALNLLGWSVPLELTQKFQAERPQLDGAYKEYVQGRGYLYRYDQAGNLNNAMNSFQTAITMDAQYESAYVGLAETHFNLFTKTKDSQWLDAMVESIDLLKVVNPKNTFIDYLSAEAALKKGDYEKAVKLYLASISQNPWLMDAQIGLASAYHKLGDIKNAELVYLDASKAAPNNWNVIVNLGVFYAQNGDYPKALKNFQKLIEISPNNHIGYRNTAGVFFIMGDIDKAIAFSKQAIAIKPSDRAYSNLGTMLFSVEKYNEAITYYKQAIELNEQYFIYWGNLADAYKLSNNNNHLEAYEQAVIRAQNMLRIDSNDTSAKVHLSYYLANLGKVEESLYYANQVNDTHSGIEHFITATSFDQLGMIEESIKHLKWAIAKKYSVEEIENTPLLKNSRSDPKFKQLLENL